MLTDRQWQCKLTPDDGDLVKLFYLPALENAERYDRITGYFTADALTLVARGIEGLARRNGRMRLLIGCTLDEREIEAIQRGEELRERVEQHIADRPLTPTSEIAQGALELLSWMIARGILDVKVAVPCDQLRKPVSSDALFHEKSGIIEDGAGNRIAWTGSLNETKAGWAHNWETIHVFLSWGPEPIRVDQEDASFIRLWANRSARAIVYGVPDAVRADLMRFLPKGGGEPDRLRKPRTTPHSTPPAEPKPTEYLDRRSQVWSFIRRAPQMARGGAQVGAATAPVDPWPHQIRAFERLYGPRRARLLIADEVGLGKTIQAGLLLRQAWLSGSARRILILAPKALLGQWQLELREKFNLNWPIYDGGNLVRYPSRAWSDGHSRAVSRDNWHSERAVIASSQLMRRSDRAGEMLHDAEPWDLVILDEAHHARRRAAGSEREGGPNSLLKLMRSLQKKTESLVLLTATPMQVHPVEVWDLLDLLDLPPEWTSDAFLTFFRDVGHPNPSHDAMERMALLFRACEKHYEPISSAHACKLTGLTSMKAGRVLRALRDPSTLPRRDLESEERRAAVTIMQAYTPLRHLVSRHTRKLLRTYHAAGKLKTPIATREIDDRFLVMTDGEDELYRAVEDYIRTTYDNASPEDRNAVGFVMTIYRRRLASSCQALAATLRRHRQAIIDRHGIEVADAEENAQDEVLGDEHLDADEAAELESRFLAAEETRDVDRLLQQVEDLPPDSKLAGLRTAIDGLRDDGYDRVMVFTQYADTMNFLRGELSRETDLRLLCFSGRGGEWPSGDGTWSVISRDEAKRRFRDHKADVFLCTDAAAEGLNFQFCGALINYDMPWNPMRVEQRIGRIDRVGQKYSTIRVINLHYDGTVETDVYRALRKRIRLFESVVGSLQPILAGMSGKIRDNILSGAGTEGGIIKTIPAQVDDVAEHGLDIDAVTAADLDTLGPEVRSPVTMDDLDRLIRSPDLMPPGVEVKSLGPRQYGLQGPEIPEEVRVTTDARFYEENPESYELWSPGNRLFRPPDSVGPEQDAPQTESLAELLDSQYGIRD